MPSEIYLHHTKPLEARFWNKVEVRTAMECWPWQATLDGGGYGQISLNGKLLKAHRLAYELTRGSIPEGFTLDHLCRRRKCVNPIHLEPVTMRENTLRGNGIMGAHTRTQTCPRGHPYSGDNLYITPTGSRDCKVCKRIRNRKWRGELQ